METINFTDIPGIKLGNAQNLEAGTGCTVVLCEEGACAGVDIRGGAPGTRETDLLNPINLVDKIHAVVLAGGSAFGLDAASGVMRYLEEKDVGFDVGVTKVPIVCSAVLFDLTCGDYKIRPDAKMGYDACVNSKDNCCMQGNIGAGTGATVGKVLGTEHSMKGGLGTYSVKVGELMIGAVVAVNCFGDVIDSTSGEILAGALNDDMRTFSNTEKIMLSQFSNKNNYFNGNTTIGVIATNAKLSKCEASKVSSMAHNGYGRTMRPAHSMFDGDTIFTVSTGEIDVDVNVVGFLAANVMENAIINAIKNSNSLYGFKAYNDLGILK